MPIPFVCSCGYSGEEDDALAGKLSACPRCGELQRVGGEQRKGVRADRPQPPAWADRAAPKLDRDPYAPPAGSTSPYAPPQAEWSAPAPGYGDSPPRDLEHEAHVVAIAAWQQITGGLLVALSLLMGVFGLVGIGSAGRQAVPALAVGGVLVLILVVFGGAMFLVGMGLRGMKNWARWVLGVLIALQLLSSAVQVIQEPTAILGAGISTAWNVAMLWALFCERANALFDPSYQIALHRTPGSPRWVASPFFWLPFVFCVLGCCLVGALGGFAGAMAR